VEQNGTEKLRGRDKDREIACQLATGAKQTQLGEN